MGGFDLAAVVILTATLLLGHSYWRGGVLMKRETRILWGLWLRAAINEIAKAGKVVSIAS